MDMRSRESLVTTRRRRNWLEVWLNDASDQEIDMIWEDVSAAIGRLRSSPERPKRHRTKVFACPPTLPSRCSSSG